MTTIPLPTIPNVLRVAARWNDSSGGQTAVNVMHFRANTPPASSSALFTLLQANWRAAMQVASASVATLYQFDITPLDGSTATHSFATGGGTNFVGGSGGNYSPASAVLVKLQTDFRGRNNRGRVYLPFIAEVAIGNGSVTNTTTLSSMNAAWLAFQTAMESGLPTGYSMGVAAYDRAHAGAGAHFNVATGISVEAKLGTQRRRQSRLR